MIVDFSSLPAETTKVRMLNTAPDAPFGGFQINYSVGYQIGGGFSNQGLPLNAEAIVQGVRDALEGTNTMIPREEMLKILQELKKKVVAQDLKQKKVLTDTFRGEGRDFLAANIPPDLVAGS